jgi:DNA-binding LytR/AlgR family response regulator
MDYTIQKDQSILIKNENYIKQVYLENICYIRCDSYLSSVYFNDGSFITCSKLLREFEEELSDFYFIRINHNTLINFKYFNGIVQQEKKRTLSLVDGSKFRVSRRNGIR